MSAKNVIGSTAAGVGATALVEGATVGLPGGIDGLNSISPKALEAADKIVAADKIALANAQQNEEAWFEQHPGTNAKEPDYIKNALDKAHSNLNADTANADHLHHLSGGDAFLGGVGNAFAKQGEALKNAFLDNTDKTGNSLADAAHHLQITNPFLAAAAAFITGLVTALSFGIAGHNKKQAQQAQQNGHNR